MVKLFISYSRVDTPFTELLVDRLRRVYGLPNVWYDDELHGGQRWWKTILEQIAACDVFVYLLSNESVTSPYCQAEFAEALRLQKPVVTVQIRDKTRLSDDLNEIQYVDMKRGLNDDNLARLIRAINELAALPKKRRALSSRLTPLPSIPESEDADAVARADIETPALAFQRPSSGGDRIVARATIVNGAVVSVLSLIGVIVAALIANLNNASTNDAAIQMAIEATRTREAAFVIQNITATADARTDTPTPTLTPTPVPTLPTSDPSLQAALSAARSFTGSNADWQALYPNGFQHTFEDGVTMVLVPAGCFMMGSRDGGIDELPVHEQCFDEPFWIDLTEMTQADFERLAGRKANPNWFDGDQRPVDQITWFEARDFCALRAARLPTEREWEYAARGPNALVHPWGSEFPENIQGFAVFNQGETADVGVGIRDEGRSWVGAYDLSGNVSEWVSSLYLSYTSLEDREADTGIRLDVSRVQRGGSWSDDYAGNLRSALRNWSSPDGRGGYGGFRCARSFAP